MNKTWSYRVYNPNAAKVPGILYGPKVYFNDDDIIVHPQYEYTFEKIILTKYMGDHSHSIIINHDENISDAMKKLNKHVSTQKIIPN